MLAACRLAGLSALGLWGGLAPRNYRRGEGGRGRDDQLSKLGDISLGNRYDVTRFNIAEFIFLSCDFEYLVAVCHENMRMIRASARRIKALKRTVFHANLYPTARVVDCPKANPLGKRVYSKWVFPGILKFVRLHSYPSLSAICGRATFSFGMPTPRVVFVQFAFLTPFRRPVPTAPVGQKTSYRRHTIGSRRPKTAFWHQ